MKYRIEESVIVYNNTDNVKFGKINSFYAKSGDYDLYIVEFENGKSGLEKDSMIYRDCEENRKIFEKILRTKKELLEMRTRLI